MNWKAVPGLKIVCINEYSGFKRGEVLTVGPPHYHEDAVFIEGVDNRRVDPVYGVAYGWWKKYFLPYEKPNRDTDINFFVKQKQQTQ